MNKICADFNNLDLGRLKIILENKNVDDPCQTRGKLSFADLSLRKKKKEKSKRPNLIKVNIKARTAFVKV